MDFSYPPEVEQFRKELRSWLAANLTEEVLAAGRRRGRDPDTFEMLRAWDAAVAAWILSAVAPETSKSLRADLERLVTEALIPERARTRAQREDYGTALRVEWERVKENWK